MTPLVLVHGFMGGSEQWDGLIARLSEKRDIIAVDLPGFGANAHLPAYDCIEDFAAWVLDDVQRRDLLKIHLLGHSMGGMIVQDMVRQKPEVIDRLVLYATGAKGELPGRFETIEESKRRAVADGADATARRIAATWFLKKEEAAGCPACADLAARAPIASILAGLEAMKNWTGESALQDIKQKTQIIWGDQDRTYAWPQIEQLWKSIPNARLAVLPDCAHAVHVEKPALFQKVLEDALPD